MSVSLVQIQSIVSTTETVGAKVPAEITKAITRAAKVREAARNVSVQRNELAELTLAAIDEDRDPATDPDVQRVITARALQDGIPDLVCNLADADVVTALQGNVDALIESWQKPFNKAAQDIANAAQRLGNIDLENAADVLHKGGDAAEQWGIATKANRTIREIMDAWSLLAHQTGFASITRHYIVLRMAEPTLEQWEDKQLVERKLTAWEAHQLGLKLSLATRASINTRISSIATQREARALNALHRETGKGSNAWVKQYV